MELLIILVVGLWCIWVWRRLSADSRRREQEAAEARRLRERERADQAEAKRRRKQEAEWARQRAREEAARKKAEAARQKADAAESVFCQRFAGKITALFRGERVEGRPHPAPRNMVPYLRSPKNKGIRDMALYDGFPDLRRFDDEEYRHVVLLALLASGGISGPFASLFQGAEDIDLCTRHLWDLGFLTGDENAPQGAKPSILGYWMIRSLYNDQNVSVAGDAPDPEPSPDESDLFQPEEGL